MSGISDSAKFNANSSYYFPSTGNTVIGVSAVNNQTGSVKLVPDASITIASSGVDTVTFSTAGNPQLPSSVNATGAIAGNTLSSATSVSGATVSATGTVTAGTSVSAAGAVSAGTTVSSGTGMTVGTDLTVTGNYISPNILTGSSSIASPIADSATVSLTALNAFLASNSTYGGILQVSLIAPASPVVGGIAVSNLFLVCSSNSGTGNSTSLSGGNTSGGNIQVVMSGAAGARVSTFSFTNGSGQPTSGAATYRWTFIH